MRLVLAGARALLVTLGSVLLAIVGLLLFVVLAVAIRPLLMLALVAGVVVSCVLSYFSPSFRRWFESVGR
jgi:predicted MFS family arabinose efflux permease